jgi:hypothetical protein
MHLPRLPPEKKVFSNYFYWWTPHPTLVITPGFLSHRNASATSA